MRRDLAVKEHGDQDAYLQPPGPHAVGGSVWQRLRALSGRGRRGQHGEAGSGRRGPAEASKPEVPSEPAEPDAVEEALAALRYAMEAPFTDAGAAATVGRNLAVAAATWDVDSAELRAAFQSSFGEKLGAALDRVFGAASAEALGGSERDLEALAEVHRALKSRLTGQTVHLPRAAQAETEELARVRAARSEIEMRARPKRRMFLNPEITTQFNVGKGGGTRVKMFRELVRRLRAIAEAEDALVAAESLQVELRGQLKGAMGRKRKRIERRLAGAARAIDKAQQKLQRSRNPGVSNRRRKQVEATIAKYQRWIAAKEEAIVAEQGRKRPREAVVAKYEKGIVFYEAKIAGEQEKLKTSLDDVITRTKGRVDAHFTKKVETARKLVEKYEKWSARKPAYMKKLRAAKRALSDAEAILEGVQATDVVSWIDQVDWTAVFADGEELTISSVKPNYKVDRPQGYKEGGSMRFSPEVRDPAIEGAYDHIENDQKRGAAVAQAKRILTTFEGNEGRVDSINTWDRAVLTMFSGIAAAGVLQRVFWNFLQEDPGGFADALGRYGIGIHRDGRRGNPYFSVVDEATGRRLTHGEAREFIANDPKLLAQLRRASRNMSFQKAAVQETVRYTVEGAKRFTFRVTVPRPAAADGKKQKPKLVTVKWSEVAAGFSGDEVDGTLAAIADWKHGGGSGGLNKLGKEYVAPAYLNVVREHEADPAAPATLPLDARREVAAVIRSTIPKSRASAMRAEFGAGLYPQGKAAE